MHLWSGKPSVRGLRIVRGEAARFLELCADLAVSAGMSEQEPRHAPGARGAMTVAMRAVRAPQDRRALRIGIVRGGKILHDRVLSEPGAISLGTAENNTFVVPGATLPKHFALLHIESDDFLLRFSPAMVGRVSLGGETHELVTLIQSGTAKTQDGAFVLRLTEDARGKLTLGDLTILFERVAAPAVGLRPQLPMTVRGNFTKSIDWLFTGFVVTSFLTHFAFVAYMENADGPVENVAERVRTAQLLMESFELPPEDPPLPPPPVLPDPHGESQPDPTVAQGPKPKHEDPSGTPEPQSHAGPSNRPDTAALTAEAVRQAENLLLGAAGLNQGGAFIDLLRDGAVTTDADDLFAAVQGSTIATQATAGLINTRQIGDGERTQGLGSLLPGKRPVGELGDSEPIQEAEVHGKIDPGEIEEEGGSGELDANEVTREIKKRLGAIRSCYEHALRRDSSLAGKLTVSFTVEQSGSLSHVSVKEDSLKDGGLSSCVTRAISSLRLRQGPEGGSVDFSYPFVFKGEQ